MESLSITVMCIIFFLAGLGLSISAFGKISDAYQTNSWQSTEGKILISRVSSELRAGDRTSSLTPHIRYEYMANGSRYESTNIQTEEISTNDQDQVEKTISQYPVGKKVTAYYNPEKPSQAVLSPGITWQSCFLLLIGLPLLIAGAIFGIINIRDRRKELKDFGY